MKKLLILGAGIYQVPLIQCARKMGIYTIVASIPGNYPGFQYADKTVYANTVDYDAILKVAKEEKIDGICTTGTDVAVITIGKVCDALGLRGVSAQGAEIACDKELMKAAFQQFGVRTAAFRNVAVESARAELEVVCEELKYPVIFKAIDSSGSRGITRVNNPLDIEKALDAVRKVTHKNTFVIERFLIGEEFGAQAFVQDGKLEFVLPHGDFVFTGDTGVPVGHYAPYDLTVSESEVFKQTELAVRAAHLDNCAINADFILCDGEPYVLEVGARAGATCLPELVSIYFGYDYYEKIIQVALGEKVDFSPCNDKRVPNASHLLISDHSGVITGINNENEALNDIIDISFDYGIGDTVRQFHVGPDRIGQVIVKGETLDRAKEFLTRVLSRVSFQVQ